MKKLIYTISMILIYLSIMTTETYACDQIPVVYYQLYRSSNCINVGESITILSAAYDPDDGTTPGDGITHWYWNYSYTHSDGPGWERVEDEYGQRVDSSSITMTFDEAGIYYFQLNVVDNDTSTEYYNQQEYTIPIYVSEVDEQFLWYDDNGSQGSGWYPADGGILYVPVSQSIAIAALGYPDSGDPNYNTYFPSGSPSWSISPSGPAISEYSSGYCLGGSSSDMVLVYSFPEPGTYTLTAKAGATDPGKSVDIIAYDVRIVSPYGDPTSSTDANDNNERVFSLTSPGILTVQCAALPTPDTTAVRNIITNKVRWTIESIGSSSLTWDSSWTGDSTKGKGLECTATFTGLPSDNDSFGLKQVKMDLILDGSTVEITKNTNIEVFYGKYATNNPGGTDKNWFYYWNQVEGLGDPDAVYTPGLSIWGRTPAMYLWPYLDPGQMDKDLIWIYDKAATTNTQPDSTKVTGIDCFADTIKHENVHVQQIHDADALLTQNGTGIWEKGWSWGDSPNNHYNPGPPVDDLDGDDDDIPDNYESASPAWIEPEAYAAEDTVPGEYKEHDWSWSGIQDDNGQNQDYVPE